jgi:hypothetical protein
MLACRLQSDRQPRCLMNAKREDEDDRNEADAQEVVGSEGGAAPWGASSRVNKEESAPKERSGDDDNDDDLTARDSE